MTPAEARLSAERSKRMQPTPATRPNLRQRIVRWWLRGADPTLEQIDAWAALGCGTTPAEDGEFDPRDFRDRCDCGGAWTRYALCQRCGCDAEKPLA